MSEFNKTKELMEQYRNFDKKSSEIKQEVVRTESLIQHLKEESENIKLEEYESSDESYINAVKEEYNKRIEEAENHKTAEEAKLNENDKDKKYFRTDSNLKTITMEIMDIDKEISKKERALKQINLDIENVFAEPDPENPLKWQELYNQRDQLNREIKELEGLKEEYTNFLNELESIKLTPDEYKEMFAREEAQNAPVENVQDNAEVEQTEEPDIINEVNQAIDKEIEDKDKDQDKEEKREEKLEPQVEEKTTVQKEEPKVVVQNVQPKEEPKTEQTNNESKDISSHSDPSNIPTLSKMKVRENTPEVVIGRNVTFRNGKDVKDTKLKTLLKNDKESLLKSVAAIYVPEKLPKAIAEKLESVDPVLMQAILEYKDTDVLSKDEAKKAIFGVVNKDKESLKNILKIRYDKDDLSKGSFWPWNKKQRDMMAKFADDNKEIAEVVGEYESNIFKRLMKKLNTKALPKGDEEKQSAQSKGKNKLREKIKSWVLTPEELARANSKSEKQTENTKSNTQKENENESR